MGRLDSCGTTWEDWIHVRTTWKAGFMRSPHWTSREDLLEEWIHERTTRKTGFTRGPHGRLDSCEDHMKDWIHERTTWKTGLM